MVLIKDRLCLLARTYLSLEVDDHTLLPPPSAIFSGMDLRRVWCAACCALLVTAGAGLADPKAGMTILSPAFAEGKPIPARYAAKGQNISPEVRIGNVPVHANSLVLIVEDPDAPAGLWTHWLVWNLSPTTTVIPEGKLAQGAVEGKNSDGNVRYDGPAPPSGTHRYFFRVYALDAMLSLPAGANRAALLAAMHGHVMASSATFGVYSAR